MKKILLVAFAVLFTAGVFAQDNKVAPVKSTTAAPAQASASIHPKGGEMRHHRHHRHHHRHHHHHNHHNHR